MRCHILVCNDTAKWTAKALLSFTKLGFLTTENSRHKLPNQHNARLMICLFISPLGGSRAVSSLPLTSKIVWDVFLGKSSCVRASQRSVLFLVLTSYSVGQFKQRRFICVLVFVR